jgi:hypothetical protein
MVPRCPALANRLPPRDGTFSGVLRNPDLRRLQFAWAFSIVSTWAYSIAIVVFSLGRAERPRSASSGSCAGSRPAWSRRSQRLLADRYERRAVMIASDSCAPLLIAGAAAAVLADASASVVYVLATLVSVAGRRSGRPRPR